MHMPGRTAESGGGYRFGFNGQEKTTELNPSHTTALFWEYDGRLGRRWNLDPKPTVGISSYSCFANNPIFNIDIYGDSLNVGQEHRKQFMSDMKNVFGDKTSSLSFNNKGNLVLEGKAKDFTKGMSKEEKDAFKGLNKAMTNKQTISVVYAEEYDLTTKIGKAKERINVVEHFGGGVYSPTDKVLIIAPSAGDIKVHLNMVEATKNKQFTTIVKQNTTSVLFHEIGEFNTPEYNETRGEVLDYENVVRKLLKMPFRPEDTDHFHPTY